LKQLRKIIELLEVLEESNPDGRVKVIVGADEQEYFTSEVQAVLVTLLAKHTNLMSPVTIVEAGKITIYLMEI